MLSDHQFQAALGRFGLGRLISAEPVSGGLFGQNVFLRTSHGEFVLRGAPHWDQVGDDTWQFPKEHFFSRTINDSGFGPPVPWPYLIDDSRDVFGWPYAITPRVTGDSGEHTFGGNHRAARDPSFAVAAGAALGQLHRVRAEHWGRYDCTLDRVPNERGSYFDYVARVIRERLEASKRASSATTPSDDEWATQTLDAARAAFQQPFVPSVVHLDFAPGNVVGIAESGQWKVTGVVDWMTAEFGDPEADLPRILTLCESHPEAVDRFLQSYRVIQPQRAGFHERFAVFMLMDRLPIWEYGQRNGVWFTAGTTMRQWIEPFTKMLDRRT